MAVVDVSVLQNLGLSNPAQTSSTSNETGDLGQGDFLELMVAQLNNQDPMEPMDNGEFLGQIAQFSAVEGIGDLQTSFADFASSLSNDQALQAANLIGRQVTVPLQAGLLNSGGSIEGELTLPASSPDVSINITDQSGQLIKTLSLGSQAAGPVPFSWDGKRTDGSLADPGVYNIESLARIDGQNFELDTQLQATVESVTLGGLGKGLQLNLSGLGDVAFSNVSRIL
ncbi:MAG: flagellar hook assembly protein FlgD [Cycloclasticus sp.]|nr:flagellar hook assembly protein FlgD [Cycloclasticus sp.]